LKKEEFCCCGGLHPHLEEEEEEERDWRKRERERERLEFMGEKIGA
jgi:hypothetical protein